VVSNVLITQGSIVIVEGALCDGIFRVSQLGAPPPEDRDSSLTNMNVTDPFGNNTRSEQLQQMLHLESASVDTMFIVISDLHLDQEQSLEKLKLVFSGFESFEGPPPVFVLMGDFVSQDFTRVGGRVAHLEAFHQLADVIAAHTRLCANAKFILAPGPADMGLNTVLPRRRLPDMIRQIMDTKVIPASGRSLGPSRPYTPCQAVHARRFSDSLTLDTRYSHPPNPPPSKSWSTGLTCVLREQPFSHSILHAGNRLFPGESSS
jgi:hypothetical protein